MQNQPRMKPMRPFHYLDQDGPAAPVAGTVARDEGGAPYFLTGYNGQTVGNKIPFPVTRDVLERGRERFNIFCAPCHARTGEGNGMIVQRGYRRPPSYHTERLRNLPLGHFYEVITNGFGAMPDYSSQIPPHDRWAIAAYIRVLQFSQNAPADLKPADAQMDALPPFPGTPGSGATPGEAAPQSGNLQAAEGPASGVQKNAADEKGQREQKEKEVKSK
jgi:mono/diheme cytochrome c family protein